MVGTISEKALWAKVDDTAKTIHAHDTRITLLESGFSEINHQVAAGNATILNEIKGLKTDLRPVADDLKARHGISQFIRNLLIPLFSLVVALLAVFYF